MTWLEFLKSLSPADLSLLLASVNLLILLLNAASGWREVDLSPHECWRFYRDAARHGLSRVFLQSRSLARKLSYLLSSGH